MVSRTNSLKIFISSLFLLFCLSTVYSLQPEINITESNVINILPSSYSLDTLGNITIYNPSNDSTIYEVYLPLEFDTFVTMDVIGVTGISSYNVIQDDDKVRVYMIPPNTSVNVSYNLYGVLSQSMFTQLAATSLSTIEFFSEVNFELTPKPSIRLEKVTRENESEDNSTRLVIAELANPGDLDYFLRNFSIYKTTASDPYYLNGTVIYNDINVTLNEYESHYVEYLDYTSTNASVYWLSSDVILPYTFNSQKSLFVTSPKSTSTKSTSTGGGGGGTFEGSSNSSSTIEKDDLRKYFIFKKTANDSILMYGEKIQIRLDIANNLDVPVYNVKVTDEVPSHYTVSGLDGASLGEDNVVRTTIPELGPYETYTIIYEVSHSKQNITGITYLKPGRLQYLSNYFYSDGVTIVDGLNKSKRIFIQKEIQPYDEGFEKVTIIVRNLGTITVEDLLITDTLDQNATIKDISQLFHNGNPGVWSIRELRPGEEWEVSYLIEKNKVINDLPTVYGIEKSEVFAILISSKEVVFEFDEQTVKIEQVGLGIAIGLVLFYILF